MKNLKLLFIAFGLVISCQSGNPNGNQSVRKEILKKEFTNKEVQSIDILEISHPMLGGVVDSIKLNKIQQTKFLADFDELEEKGMLKCKSTHIIRINLISDTLRLKVCGSNVSNRTNDMYYQLPNSKSLIKEYLTN